MPRPKKKRCIELNPCLDVLMPVKEEHAGKNKGIEGKCVCLEMDELEAIRLADYLGLYHEEAAKKMGVSRVTFGRILKSGRNKLARALIEGLGIRIEKE